jgi:D-3-phosphoglycerate dehydrogenase / 2-oxoglutarate reductase
MIGIPGGRARVVFVNDVLSDETIWVYQEEATERGDVELLFRNEVGQLEDSPLASTIDLILVGTERLRVEDVDACVNLQGVHKLGTGVDNVPIEHLRMLGIPFRNNQGVNANQVAEHCVAMMLAHYRQILVADRGLRSGVWLKPVLRTSLSSLSGRTVALAGFGATAREVTRLLRPWGCTFKAYDPYVASTMFEDLDVLGCATLEDAADGSDILTLHLPLMPSTERVVGSSVLSRLNSGGLVINTSRAGVLDLDALSAFLDLDPEAGAALDVFDAEPIEVGDRVLRLPRTILTPHIAGASRELIRLHFAAAINSWSKEEQ